MDLLGLAEVAELAGVSPQAVANWKTRYRNFPNPITVLKGGPVWRREDIVAWLRQKEGKMTKVISFINLKGGVAKTTNAVAVSEFLAEEHNKHVLLVDLDPQTNATVALIAEDEWKKRDDAGRTLLQLFKDKIDGTDKFDINKAIIRGVSNLHGGIKRLSLLPSSLGLIDLQDRLALIPSGNFYSLSPVEILAGVLKPIIEVFDYVIVDCPPNLGIITLNGIAISTGYVIPVIPDILSTFGIPQILNRVETFTKTKAIKVPAKAIIASKYRVQNPLHVSRLKQLRREANTGKLPPVLDTVIPETAKISGAADFSGNVNTLKQKYGYGNIYELYSSLTKEFIAKC